MAIFMTGATGFLGTEAAGESVCRGFHAVSGVGGAAADPDDHGAVHEGVGAGEEVHLNDLFLEVCIDSVESAIEAQHGGADRLELCADLIIGGTTPTESLFRAVRRVADLPVHVMVRPRYGDFLYTDYEYEVMLDTVRSFRNLGADGVVTGILKADGSLDLERMTRIREVSEGMKLTLHRAFDMSCDPRTVMTDSVKCGVDIVLTSGQAPSAEEGIPVLRGLQEEFGSRVEIMAGAGVNARNIPLIHEKTGIRNFHLSGKKEIPSGMAFRNERVSMGVSGFPEYSIMRTDAERVREAARICKKR